MRYQVPQFIEVEDKIFGPLTLKQFIYLVGGAGLCFVLWRLLPLFIAVFFIAPVAAFSIALAFYKINNRPLIDTIEYAFKYGLSSKLYLWEENRRKKPSKKKEEVVKKPLVEVPKMSQSRLKDLAWSLDIKSNLEDTEK
ncbi:MAG: PrgI family protein [Candidatus Pacebacteria bacterium]|jgi:hypothetical protein|nr:hypothetical protein [bacterium]MDP6528027.1 PrgI family protein [Candidatus Paceibacterota bacterium]|tara:strand:+ start:1201 stop:1617 length:417 start_codon:yes stop_codon:yes gene_type:complete